MPVLQSFSLMTSRQIVRIMTLIANFSLLLGIGLVAYELNQNQALARTELVNDGSGLENQVWANLMGENPATTIARVIQCPSSVSYADFLAVDAFLYTSLNDVYREYELSKEGLFEQDDWQSEVETYAHWFLANRFGRAWWEEQGRDFFDQRFADYVDQHLAQIGPDSYSYWQRVHKRLTGGQVRPSCPVSTVSSIT